MKDMITHWNHSANAAIDIFIKADGATNDHGIIIQRRFSHTFFDCKYAECNQTSWVQDIPQLLQQWGAEELEFGLGLAAAVDELDFAAEYQELGFVAAGISTEL